MTKSPIPILILPEKEESKLIATSRTDENGTLFSTKVGASTVSLILGSSGALSGKLGLFDAGATSWEASSESRNLHPRLMVKEV